MSSFAEFKYGILWKKSVLSWKTKAVMTLSSKSSETFISHMTMKATTICFKFTHELHINISWLIRAWVWGNLGWFINHQPSNKTSQKKGPFSFSNHIMKDFPIFFNFTQELHLIELCLTISLVCSKVPIHLEKSILWRVKQLATAWTRNLYFQFGKLHKSASLRNSAKLRRLKARTVNLVPQ